MTGQLLSLSAVAGRLGVSVPTLRRWISEGTLAAFKLGGQIRVEESAVDAMLESARIQPAVAPRVTPRARPAPASGGLRALL